MSCPLPPPLPPASYSLPTELPGGSRSLSAGGVQAHQLRASQALEGCLYPSPHPLHPARLTLGLSRTSPSLCSGRLLCMGRRPHADPLHSPPPPPAIGWILARPGSKVTSSERCLLPSRSAPPFHRALHARMYLHGGAHGASLTASAQVRKPPGCLSLIIDK